MPSTVRGFYDDLACDYHRMYADWDSAVGRHGLALAALLGEGSRDVLDCAAGIGTQAIGLALAGHRVVATDLSPAALKRARREAVARDARMSASVADFRRLPFRAERFDAVVCADNSIAHMLTDADLATALTSMYRVLRPGGLLILSIRGDYAELRRRRTPATMPRVSYADGRRTVTFQLWEWHADGERYDLEHLQLHECDGGDRVSRRRTTLRALTVDELAASARRAGFEAPVRREPSDSGFFQSVLTVTRPADRP